jgi:hypothetical protein
MDRSPAQSTRVEVGLVRPEGPRSHIVLDVPVDHEARALEGTVWPYVGDYDLEIGMGGMRLGAPVIHTVEAGVEVAACWTLDEHLVGVEVTVTAPEPSIVARKGIDDRWPEAAIESARLPLARWRGRARIGTRTTVPIGALAVATVAVSPAASCHRDRPGSVQGSPAEPSSLRVTLRRHESGGLWRSEVPFHGTPERARVILRPSTGDPGIEWASGWPPLLTSVPLSIREARLRGHRVPSFHADDATIDEILEELRDRTSIDLVVAPAARASAASSDARISIGPLEDVSAAEILDLALAPAGLEREFLGERVHVVPGATLPRGVPRAGGIAVEGTFHRGWESDSWFTAAYVVNQPPHRWRKVETAEGTYAHALSETRQSRLPVFRTTRGVRHLPAAAGGATARLLLDLGRGREPFDLRLERTPSRR